MTQAASHRALSTMVWVSFPGRFMWDLRWTNWYWDRIFSEYFYRYAVSVSHHSCSILVFDLCTTDTGVRGGTVD